MTDPESCDAIHLIPPLLMIVSDETIIGNCIDSPKSWDDAVTVITVTWSADIE